MKTQRFNFFAKSSCVRCGQPVGIHHMLVVEPGARFRFCGIRCLYTWSCGKIGVMPGLAGAEAADRERMQMAFELREQAIDRAMAADALTDGGFTT